MEAWEIIKQEEEALQFSQFNGEMAWRLGNLLVERARQGGRQIAIGVSLCRRRVFYYAFDGTSPDNDGWVRRKENLAYYMGKSSYQVKLYLDFRRDTLQNKYALDPADYAASGGSVPIRLAGTGVVGAATVSGMAQAEDHAFVVAALRDYLQELRGKN